MGTTGRAEAERAGRLLAAPANAVALFDEVVTRGVIAAGRGEQAASDEIRDLANEMFGKSLRGDALLSRR